MKPFNNENLTNYGTVVCLPIFIVQTIYMCKVGEELHALTQTFGKLLERATGDCRMFATEK